MQPGWGQNPFTNFSQPFGQSNTWSTGQQQNPYSQNAGQFNPQAMNFSGQQQQNPYSTQSYSGMGGGYGSMPPWMNQGSQGYGGMSQGGFGGMPPWMNQGQGMGYGGGMGGGMPPWMQGGMGRPRVDQFGQASPYPNNPQIDPNTNLGAQGVGNAPMPNAQPGTDGNLFSNVIHDGSFDSANAPLSAVTRRFLGM